ncbi:MAG: TolC family protein [Candidatus Scalindua sp.]|nr:TolC family protein [Candidatus Scalindua sp.]
MNSYKMTKKSTSILLQLRIIISIVLCICIFQCGSFANENRNIAALNDYLKNLRLLEAVQHTIAKQPNILLDDWQVKVNEGLWQIQRGTFNTTVGTSVSNTVTHTPLNRYYRNYYGTSETVERVTEYSVDISKEFRSGVEFTPNVTVSSTEDLALHLTTTRKTETFATVSFDIKIPLLRERGRAANAADEMSAKILTEASRYDLNYTTSQSILTTVNEYWNTVAAMGNLEIAEKAESRAGYMLEQTKTLVDAGEQPASDLYKLTANLHGKTSTRINKTQGLFEARQTLGLAMGLRFDEIVATPLPSEPLLDIDDADLNKIPIAQNLIDIGLERRADLIALKKEQESAKVLMVGAHKNLKPQLDLDLSAGYIGLNENTRRQRNLKQYTSSINEREAGLNFSAMFSLEWPVLNDYRRGTYVRREAQNERAVISTNNLTRQIVSNVTVAMSDVIQSAAELKKALESVLVYQTAVEKQRLKLKLGETTIIDLIDVDDRLTTAMYTEVSARLSYAKALVQLRFETGTILSPDLKNISVSMKELTTVPSAN